MPTLINPCSATPKVCKTSPSKRRKITHIAPIIEPPNRNPIQTTFKLLDASNEVDVFVESFKDDVDEIKKLPRDVKTTQLCNEINSLLNHFEGEVSSVLKVEIIPKVRSAGSTSYVCCRLKHASS